MTRLPMPRRRFGAALPTWSTVAMIAAAAFGVVQFGPSRLSPTKPFAAIDDASSAFSAGASLNAFGASREVMLRFALPNAPVEFPVEVSGDPVGLRYGWVPVRDTLAMDGLHRFQGDNLVAPAVPGFYRLAVLRGADRQIIPQPTLAVMVPFAAKVGNSLNGYRIGTYLAERFRAHSDHPAGFLEVQENDLELHVSRHLTLGDFVTHDAQVDVWPKYVALNPRLLDKLELVLTRIGTRARLAAQANGEQDVALDVHSGFRTPLHNRAVRWSARDSRHQYGDAADVAIDANGDGLVTLTDELLVAQAVDQVEDEHPELVGGLGLYVSRRYRTPYVHIDARGKRTRWKG